MEKEISTVGSHASNETSQGTSNIRTLLGRVFASQRKIYQGDCRNVEPHPRNGEYLYSDV